MKQLFVILISIIGLATMAQGQSHDVYATMYYATRGGCTASGSRVVPSKVKSGEHRWVALSRDLFKAGYRMGDTIVVTSANNSFVNGYWVVKDKMAGRRKIDFLVHRSDARKFPQRQRDHTQDGRQRRDGRERRRAHRAEQLIELLHRVLI